MERIEEAPTLRNNDDDVEAGMKRQFLKPHEMPLHVRSYHISDLDTYYTDDELIPINPRNSGPSSGTIYGAILNLSNATIGAGVLGLPYLVRECGLVLGVIMIIVFGFVANYTLSLLQESSLRMLFEHAHSKFVRTRAYEDIAEDLNGFKVATLVKCSIIIINFGGVLSYLIIIGDMLLSSFLTQVEGNPFYVQRWFVVGMITLFILIPISTAPRMSNLYWASLLSMISVLTFTLIVVFYYFFGDTQKSGELVFFRILLSIFEVLGILTFAYSVHTSLLPIAKDFNVPTGMRTAIRGAVSISAVTYILIGIFGYLSFLEDTKGDLVLSYASKDVFIDAIKVIMAISISLTMPTIIYPCRLSLDNLLFPKHQSPHSSLDVFFEVPHLRLVTETVFILGLGYILSTVFPSITVVFSLTGSTASTLTSYIFPAVFYLQLTKWEHWYEPKSLPAVLVIVGGSLLGVISTIVTIVGIFVDV